MVITAYSFDLFGIRIPHLPNHHPAPALKHPSHAPIYSECAQGVGCRFRAFSMAKQENLLVADFLETIEEAGLSDIAAEVGLVDCSFKPKGSMQAAETTSAPAQCCTVMSQSNGTLAPGWVMISTHVAERSIVAHCKKILLHCMPF